MGTVRILARRFLSLHHKMPVVPVHSSLYLPILTCPSQYQSPIVLSSTSDRGAYSTSASSATSPASPQNEYLVVIPDHPNTSAARAKARPGHVKAATPLIDAGVLTYFGVTLSDVTEGQEQRINGSAIVMKAGSEVEVRNFLSQDEYTKFGVWNVSQAKIWRFRSG